MVQVVGVVVMALLLAIASKAEPVNVSIIGDAASMTRYQQWVLEHGDEPLSITEYDSPSALRGSTSLLLLLQALASSDLEYQHHFIHSPNVDRSLRQIRLGKALVYLADIWETDFDDSTYQSTPILYRGQFEKGLYVHESSPLLDYPMSIEQVKALSAAVVRTWHYDIEVLEKAGFSSVVGSSSFDVLLKLVQRRRVDFACLEFPNRADLAYETELGRFVPLPGYKIQFKRGRHFMVSKLHPDGDQVYRALEQGLGRLRQQGRLRKALLQSGVINPYVQGWQSINL